VAARRTLRLVPSPIVLLAPGASGNPASVKPFADALVAAGMAAHVISLPRGSAERALPVYRQEAADIPAPVIGGQSFGGRVASMLAAERSVAGLVLICYPLHPPGRGERWEQRTEHWPSVACPTLLLSGDRDPFARIELLREAVTRLPNAELHVYPGVGHGLRAIRQDAAERIMHFVQEVAVHSDQ
jgi:predicted alpha/beta-hydrolase family hydrolase